MRKNNKITILLPCLFLSTIALSGCQEDEIRVLRVLNSEDYIYECDYEEYYCDECEDYVDNHYAYHEINGDEHEVTRDKLTGWYCPTCKERISYDDVTCTATCTHSVVFDEETQEYSCNTCDEVIDESEVEVDENNYYYHELTHEVYLDLDIIDQFAADWYDRTGEKISVVYDTYDTNETMYNTLNTGKTTYDVIITSDYMIQKCITNNMLHKLGEYDETSSLTIWDYVSPELESRFNNIFAERNVNDNQVNERISDYSVPFMWGTVGIMYNPDFYIAERGISTKDKESEEYQNELTSIIEDFKSWETLYNTDPSKKYSKSFSIKDSVRDTYAVSLIHAFKDEIANIETKYSNDISEAGLDARMRANTQDPELLDEIQKEAENAEINRLLSDIFNRSDEETIALVKEDMKQLKANAFGFETDSGKTDMVDQKIGANMCWSGDATWAIWVAEDPSLEESDDGKERQSVNLYYSTPTGLNGEEASNIWVDAFCLIDNGSGEEAEKQYELAQAFVEYMCMPDNAVQNSDAVGYTSGTAGDAMLDYFYFQYDVRGEVGGDVPQDQDYEEYDLRYFFDGSLEEYDSEDAILYAYPEYVNRQLAAQFPRKESLVRLCTMNNFPEVDTINLLNMWEQVRTNELPSWATIVFIVEIVVAGGLASLLIVHKVQRKKNKKERV